MGLDPHRDRLCVVQLSPGDGSADVVQISARRDRGAEPEAAAHRSGGRQDLPLRPLRSSPSLSKRSGSCRRPVYCTKIASRLTRTYTDRHGLKDLVRDLLGIDLSKQQQLSDWGAES